MSKYFKLNGNTQYILSWKSKGLSSESIMPSPVSNNLFNPLLGYSGTKPSVQYRSAIFVYFTQCSVLPDLLFPFIFN